MTQVERKRRRTSREEIAELVAFMSRTSSLDERATRSIEINEGEGLIGYLIPLPSEEERRSSDCWSLRLQVHDADLNAHCVFLIQRDGVQTSVGLKGDTRSSNDELVRAALRETLGWMEVHLDAEFRSVILTGFEGLQIEKSDFCDYVGLAPTRILTAGPMIGPREAAYTLDATRHGWNAHYADYLNRFEEEFASFVGAKHALGTSSCTGALHLALLALGIGPGDEVIVPETTWVATAAAVRYVGATPVFADVDERSWTLTIETLEPCLTERTRAIIPVHLYGFPADMVDIMVFARDNGLSVVEDAAPAIGALVRGEPVGSFGDMSAFSFQGAKMLVTGEGGMLVTKDDELFARAWKQQDHGRVPDTFWIDELGRKYKMSNLSAALGLAQLHSAETQIVKKRRINRWYRKFLSDTRGLTFQQENADTDSICWMTSITLDPEVASRDELTTFLDSCGIDTRPVFPPISRYPIWDADVGGDPGTIARRVGECGINLPSGVNLSRAAIERVAEMIHRFVRNAE